MNNLHNPPDMYYNQSSSRSPDAQRHPQQTLHRQPSRQFDAYGPMPTNIYQPEDSASRYDGNRFDRINPTMQGGAYGYDMPSAHTWNPTAFGAANGFPNYGANTRMKTMPRGRSALPPVSSNTTVTGNDNPTDSYLDLARSTANA